MNSQVSIVKCKQYEPSLVQVAVKQAVDLLGGISGFIKPQSKVLVKPNLLMAKEPEFAITTHPEVVRSVVRLLKEIDCQIYLGDGPSVWGSHAEKIDEVYEKTGIKKIAEEEKITLVSFDKTRWKQKFPLTCWLDECDYLVSIPKFKTHELTILTGAIKNIFGLVGSSYRSELHKKYFAKDDFAKVPVDVYELAQPALTIIDGIVAMEGDGPATSGKPRPTGLVIAGSDGVAIDSILALIMGIEPLDILTTKEAAYRGLGVAEIESIDILGEKLEAVTGSSFLLPSASITRRLPRPLVKIAGRFVRFYPKINHHNCTLCGGCINICPNKIMSIKSKKIVIDYAQCISCFCCQEVCSFGAISVKKSMLAKMIGL